MNLKSKKLMLIALPVLVILFGTIFLPACKSPASATGEVRTMFTLTVGVGEGVAGYPAASGTTDYPDGTSISYSYSLENGYTNLEVRVDTFDANASGTIIMDKNHSLYANATKVVTFTQTD